MPVRSNAYPELDRDLTFQPLGDHGLQHLIPFQVSDFNTRGFICPYKRVHSSGGTVSSQIFCDAANYCMFLK